LTAGRPYLIQKICISLISRLHEQRRRSISIDDVRAVANMAPGTAAGMERPAG
jgi:hypothetical protein